MKKILGLSVSVAALLLSGCGSMLNSSSGGSFAQFYEGKMKAEIAENATYQLCSSPKTITLTGKQVYDKVEDVINEQHREGYALVGESHSIGQMASLPKSDATGLGKRLGACKVYWGVGELISSETQSQTYNEQVVVGTIPGPNGSVTPIFGNRPYTKQVTIKRYQVSSYYFVKLDVTKSWGIRRAGITDEQKKMVGVGNAVWIQAVMRGSQADTVFGFKDNDILLAFNGLRCTTDNISKDCGVSGRIKTMRVYRNGQTMNLDMKWPEDAK